MLPAFAPAIKPWHNARKGQKEAAMAQANKTAKAARKTERKDSVTSNEIASVKSSGKPLSGDEQQQLAKCEAVIKKGLQAFLEVAAALLEVRDQELFRATHNTFQKYCAEKWGITSRHANRLVLAGEVVKCITEDQMVSRIPAAVPQNEAQARELASLPPEKQIEVAREVDKATKNPTAMDFRLAKVEAEQAEAKMADDDADDEDKPADKPRVTNYTPPTPPVITTNSEDEDDGGAYDLLLTMVDTAQTQARRTPGCSEITKLLGEIAKKVQQIKAKGGQ